MPNSDAEDQKAAYQSAVKGCLLASLHIIQWDLPKMLAAIERAHAVGPILDPTLYREKAKAMEEDAELLRAALPLWQLVMKRAEAADAARKAEATRG